MSNQRSFFKLYLTKNKLKATTMQERTNSLVLRYRSTDTQFDIEDVIQEYSQKKPRSELFEGSARRKSNPYNVWTILSLGLAEAVGTGMLVFMGCVGGIPGLTPAAPPALQHALVFGITVATIIQVFGHVSGAHLNPAVTASAWVWGLVTLPIAGLYILSQFIGAVLGYATILVMTPPHALYPGGVISNVTHGFCTTVPNPAVSVLQAFIGEYLATSILILLCCGVWDKRNATKQDSTPLKFGLTIAAIALSVGPYTGASMNPARTFGPALFTGVWDHHWIYWVGPLTAGVLVTYFYKFIFDRNPSEVEADHSDIPLNQSHAKSQVADKASNDGQASV